MLLVGRQERHPACKKLWGAGVVICPERGADQHIALLMPCYWLSLASVKSRLVLPFWYRLTWVVPDKGPLNACVCVWGGALQQIHTYIQIYTAPKIVRTNLRRWMVYCHKISDTDQLKCMLRIIAAKRTWNIYENQNSQVGEVFWNNRSSECNDECVPVSTTSC